MQLKAARISHFRSLRDIKVDFGAHTALIGGNGAGKSSVLKAIERFYSTARVLDKDDFFGRDQSQAVEIELTFSNLSIEENETFDTRIRNNELVVTRVFDTSASSGSYYGSVPQNKDFSHIQAQGNATAKRDAYKELKASNPAYLALPNANSAALVDAALLDWEAKNPHHLTLERDDGRFFGFQNAGQGALQRHTSFVFVPAVREALNDAADNKTSPIGRLLEIVVRSAILKRKEVVDFKEKITQQYKDIVSPENMPELKALASRLTTDLKGLYAKAEVGLDWRETGEIPIPLPAADVMLSDDGFGGPVDRQGHGLQRAFVFTLLQHLARVSTDIVHTETDVTKHSTAPDLILAVEEPELYQHPTKQRHLSQVLRGLSSKALPGTSGTTQVVFASHSPMFVSLGKPDEIRLIRRTDCEDSDYKQCEMYSLDLDSVASKLEFASYKTQGKFSAATLTPRLHILGTELAEGFFADGIVLVEGRSDRAALMAYAQIVGKNFEASGIAVLPVEGKNNLDRPYLIFRELGIPVYVVWDCDCGTSDYKSDANLALNRLVNPELNLLVPCEETHIGPHYSHFSRNLEHCIKSEISPPVYDKCLSDACAPYGFSPSKDAQKSPDIMQALLTSATALGKDSPSLDKLVKAILAHFDQI